MPYFNGSYYQCDCPRLLGTACACMNYSGGGLTLQASKTINVSGATTLMPYDPINEYRKLEDDEIMKLTETLDLVSVMDNVDLLFKIRARFFLELDFVRWIGMELPETKEKVRINVDRLIALTNPNQDPQPLEKQVLFG